MCVYVDFILKNMEQVTVGITALFLWRVRIDKEVCDLDVELGLSFRL